MGPVNSFAHPLGEVHFDRYVPADVLPALDAAEPAARALLDAVAGSPEPLLALGAATAGYEFVMSVVWTLADVLGGGWQEVSRPASERAARFRSAIYQRRDLYDAVRAHEPAGPVERRLRTDLLRRFEQSGAHLDPAGQERLATITARLAGLAADFTDNLSAADAAAGVPTGDPGGLPAELVEQARAAAAERGLPGWWVPYSDANLIAVLRDARDRALREGMYRLTISRAAKANGPVLAQVLALRQELATLLGYPDYVQLQVAGRMVPDPQALMDRLAAAYRPQADREYAELLAFARAYTGDPELELTAADVDVQYEGYYAARLRESRGAAATASVRVPVPLATEVMLTALAELYQVSFTRVDAPGWHPDVETYDLRDAAGEHLARIWCDWCVREGKQPGRWFTTPWFGAGTGASQLTVVTNMPRSGADLGELRIMWHEFGHCLHYAFTRTRYRQRSPSWCPHDFIEGPSRIMEEWPLDPEILRRMGVDERAAAAARAEDGFRVASRRMVRMVAAALDLALHRGEDPGPVKQRHLPVPLDPADATATEYGHVFGGHYGAGHYAYSWAGVLAASLFTRFAAEGLLNPVTGRDYATRVLAPGAERDPAAMVRDFLGHAPSLAALLARDGIG
jgi:oligopeptidase A